jgi:hypothetical protein
MNVRERSANERKNDPPASGPPEGHLGELRKAGEDLLAAGDDAIRRALSGDSLAFLIANRQEGGQ